MGKKERHHIKITHSGNTWPLMYRSGSTSGRLWSACVKSNLQQRKSLAQLLAAQPSGRPTPHHPSITHLVERLPRDGGWAGLQLQGQAGQQQQTQQSSHETGEPINWLILLIMFGHRLAGLLSLGWYWAHSENRPGSE